MDSVGPTGASIETRARRLVEDNFQRIWRLLCRLGVARSDAEDAAQQVFLITTSRLADIPPQREHSFLYSTAIRVASVTRRNQNRRQRWVDVGYDESMATAPSAEHEIERRDALKFLDEVLNGLDQDLRRVFVLCEIETFTAIEVASLLGIPVGTVASRLRRARQKFDERAARLRAHSRM